MFGRAMADRHGVGIIVSIDYHGASYDIQTPRLLCKHLTAAEVHPVPAGLTLAHRLGPDATPARRFAATAVDDGAFQRLFEAYKPDSDAPDHLLHRQTRYAFAQAAETLNWRGMADAMATLPRVTSLSPSATLYDWAMDVMSAACDGTAMPERPHGLYAERARAERRSKAIMPTTFAALCERERLAAFADVCRQWRVLGQVVEAPADGRHHRVGQCGADARHASQRSDPGEPHARVGRLHGGQRPVESALPLSGEHVRIGAVVQDAAVAVDHGEPVDQQRRGDGADRGGQVRHRVVMRLRGRPTRRQSDRTVPVVAFQHRQPRQDRRHGQRGPIRETSSVQHELNGNVERSQTPSCVRSQSTGPASR